MASQHCLASFWRQTNIKISRDLATMVTNKHQNALLATGRGLPAMDHQNTYQQHLPVAPTSQGRDSTSGAGQGGGCPGREWTNNQGKPTPTQAGLLALPQIAVQPMASSLAAHLSKELNKGQSTQPWDISQLSSITFSLNPIASVSTSNKTAP